MTGAAVTGAVRAVSKGADLTGELLVQHLASALGLPRGDDPWQVRAEALLETVRGLARPVVEDQAVAAGDQPSSGELGEDLEVVVDDQAVAGEQLGEDLEVVVDDQAVAGEQHLEEVVVDDQAVAGEQLGEDLEEVVVDDQAVAGEQLGEDVEEVVDDQAVAGEQLGEDLEEVVDDQAVAGEQLGEDLEEVVVNDQAVAGEQLGEDLEEAVAGEQGRWWTTQHPPDRQRTFNPARFNKLDLLVGRFVYPEQVIRPTRRSDCEIGVRPCPFVSCKYHLATDVDRYSGSLTLTWPERELWTLSETCSLDVAARGGSTLEEVAGFLNITRERVRQIEARALVQIRRRPSRIAALQEHLHG